MTEAIHEKSKDMARNMARQADEAIASAIKARCGEFDIHAFDMSRLTRQINQDKVELFLLDGKPLIELYPMTFSERSDDSGHKLTAKRRYREFQHD